MATGASTADLALVLVDVRKGILPQTRRHACIAWLLGIPRILVVVNKMDLAGYTEEAFDFIRRRFAPLSEKLVGCAVDFIPVSALQGDNVAARSKCMPWFDGPSVLEYLDSVSSKGANGRGSPFRFPIQQVIRTAGFRGYAGQIASGVVRPGDDVVVLPSGFRARVASVASRGPDRVEKAFAPMSVCRPSIAISMRGAATCSSTRFNLHR